MKFVISRQELSELISHIQNIVAVKAPVPILSNFLLEAIDSRIVVTATDLTVSVRASKSAKILEPGSITIPARRFGNLLKELTSSHLEISVSGRDVITIVADSSTFKLPGMPKKDFPEFQDFTDAQVLRMKQSELKDMFFRTAFAVSKEDSRYILTGVYLHISQGMALFVGTDGKRLARSSYALKVSPDITAECIIPLKAVDEMIKGLQADEEAILYIMSDKIALEACDMTIMTKLLSGEYPDVNKIMPQQFNNPVSLHREELMSLLRQISLFTTEKNPSVRFSFLPGELQLSVNTADVGEGKVSMPVNYTGKHFDIAFNPHFFLDILRHSKQDAVSISFSDAYNPGIIADGEVSFQGESMPSPLFVLMPMRLNEEVAAS